LGVRRNAFAMEAREERGRAGSVETFVVIEDAHQQILHSSASNKTGKTGTVQHQGAARLCQGEWDRACALAIRGLGHSPHRAPSVTLKEFIRNDEFRGP